MVETFLTPIPREVWYVMSMICLYMNKKAHVVYNFNSKDLSRTQAVIYSVSVVIYRKPCKMGS